MFSNSGAFLLVGAVFLLVLWEHSGCVSSLTSQGDSTATVVISHRYFAVSSLLNGNSLFSLYPVLEIAETAIVGCKISECSAAIWQLQQTHFT